MICEYTSKTLRIREQCVMRYQKLQSLLKKERHLEEGKKKNLKGFHMKKKKAITNKK